MFAVHCYLPCCYLPLLDHTMLTHLLFAFYFLCKPEFWDPFPPYLLFEAALINTVRCYLPALSHQLSLFNNWLSPFPVFYHLSWNFQYSLIFCCLARSSFLLLTFSSMRILLSFFSSGFFASWNFIFLQTKDPWLTWWTSFALGLKHSPYYILHEPSSKTSF